MTWATDTLSPAEGAVQLLPVDMLAFSTDDIWLACWSDVAKRVMWHFDGSEWVESDIEGQSGPIGLDAITGNSSGDLWAGGFYGIPSSYVALSHYNGAMWEKTDLKIQGEILDMCTDPSGNIWACGRNGLILKNSNNKWSADTLRVPHYNEGEYFLTSIAYYRGKAFVLARVIDSNKKIDLYYYATGDIGNWKIEDSVIVDQPFVPFKWGQWKLYPSDFGNMYSIGLNGIWKYNGESWNKIYSDHTYLYYIYGANENYLVAVGDYGEVLYYDGSSWQNILNFLKVGSTDFIFTNVWTNGREIFIAGYGTIDGVEKTIIWHGK